MCPGAALQKRGGPSGSLSNSDPETTNDHHHIHQIEMPAESGTLGENMRKPIPPLLLWNSVKHDSGSTMHLGRMNIDESTNLEGLNFGPFSAIAARGQSSIRRPGVGRVSLSMAPWNWSKLLTHPRKNVAGMCAFAYKERNRQPLQIQRHIRWNGGCQRFEVPQAWKKQSKCHSLTHISPSTLARIVERSQQPRSSGKLTPSAAKCQIVGKKLMVWPSTKQTNSG